MNLRTPALLLLVLAGFGSGLGLAPQVATPSGPPTTFKIDPVHSTALFRVHHLGAGRFYGRFNDVTGSITYAEGSDQGPSFDVSIAIESVDTNSENLDNHLKSPDFFNAKEFPTMTFKSASARKTGDTTYDVRGDLTIRGITKPMTVVMELTGVNDAGPRAGYRCGFETTFTIKRSEFEITYGVSNGALSDETKVIVSLEGVRQ